MDRTLTLFRMLFLTACGVAGWFISIVLMPEWRSASWIGSASGLIFGLFIVLADRLMKGVSLRAFSSATFGLTLGCVLAALIWSSRIFAYTPEEIQWILHLAIYLAFGYLGGIKRCRLRERAVWILLPLDRSKWPILVGPVGLDILRNLLLVGSVLLGQIAGRVKRCRRFRLGEETHVPASFLLTALRASGNHHDASRSGLNPCWGRRSPALRRRT